MPSPRDIDLFLLDMDGTIYLGDRLFDCTRPFLETLRAQGKRHLFLTNNSSKDRMAYVAKLARLGIEAEPDDVFTSGEATTRLLLGRMPGAAVAVFGMPTLEREFREAGFRLVEREPDVVVLGFDQAFDYAKMTRLCDLVREGRPYVATHPDFNCPTETGFAPDIGAIMAFIEASTGRRPDLIVGKPHTGIVEAVLKRTGLKVGELAMVGDRLYTDIETGRRSGMTSILVMSGETTPEMRDKSDIKADYVFDRLSSMIEYL